MSWLDKPNTQIRADDGTLFPPQPTTQVTGPGAPAVSTDPANKQTILTFPDATIVTKRVDAGSAPIAQGYVAMQKNGKLTLATTADLALGLYHAGIVLAPGVAGGQTSIITQGMIDPTTFNLGAGAICAVGTDANGKPVRVTDPTCVSGLKFLGACDTNGAIYVSPTTNSTLDPRACGAAWDGVTNDAAAMQLALDTLYRMGGGVLECPAGTCNLGATPIVLPSKVQIKGAGKRATIFVSTSASDVLQALAPLNGSTSFSGGVFQCAIHNTNVSNTGAALWQRAGSYFDVEALEVEGCKYGVIFDQTEVSSIRGCDFEGCATAGVWLTNGADYSAGGQAGFTNSIWIERNQFNGGAVGIIDDGGGLHYIEKNNFNANSVCAAYLAGAGAFTFRCNEIEGTPVSLHFAAQSYLGTGGTGTASGNVDGCLLAGATNCVVIDSAGKLVFGRGSANEYSCTGTAIVGASNAAFIDIGSYLLESTSQQIADGKGAHACVSSAGGGPLGSPALPWLPCQLIGLAMWLRADAVVQSGGAISKAIDLTGNGYDAAQATAANKPTTGAAINGAATMHFDPSAAGQFLTSAAFPTALTASHVFIVHKSHAAPPATGQDGWNSYGSTDGDVVPFAGDGHIYIGTGSSARKTTGVAPSPALTTANVVETISTAAEFTLLENGAQLFTTATNAVGWGSLSKDLGASSGHTNFYFGDIAEVLIFDHKLSVAERGLLVAYFNARYALGTA